MWQKVVLIAVPIVLVVVGFGLHSWRVSTRLDTITASLDATNKELASSKAEIEQLKDISVRQDKANDLLFKHMTSGVESYVQKVRSINADKSACDWLDIVLPDSVREQYAGTVSGSSDSETACLPVRQLRQTAAQRDDNK